MIDLYLKSTFVMIIILMAWSLCRSKKETLDNLDSECIICMENFQNDKYTIRLECKHFFHKECVVQWFTKNASCPICRRKVYSY